MCNTIKGIQHPKYYAVVESRTVEREIPASKVKDKVKELQGNNSGKKISIREHGTGRLVVRIAKWI